MKFRRRTTSPTTFGPPDDPTLPNWVRDALRPVDVVGRRRRACGRTRAATRSIETESSGMAVVRARAVSHILGIGDNYNNPFSDAAARGRTPGRGT